MPVSRASVGRYAFHSPRCFVRPLSLVERPSFNSPARAQVGVRVAERFTAGMSRFAKKLEKVKFVCKEMWIELFHKQADKLRTNYVRHVLHDFRVGSAARTTMSSMRCSPCVYASRKRRRI